MARPRQKEISRLWFIEARWKNEPYWHLESFHEYAKEARIRMASQKPFERTDYYLDGRHREFRIVKYVPVRK